MNNTPPRSVFFSIRARPWRVAACVVVLFVVLDLTLQVYLDRRFADGMFRLPKDSRALLDEYLDFLSTQPGKRIYCVGDSTMHGQRLDAQHTTPAQMRALLAGGAWSPVNLGLTAAKVPDFFYLTARLPARAREIAVYNINYKNFGTWDLALPMRFVDLYDPALDSLAGPDAAAVVGADKRRTPAGDWSGRLDAAVQRVWRFYRCREWVAAALFGLHPRKLVKSYHQVLIQTGVSGSVDRLLRRRHRTDWTQTRWDDWALKVLRSYYDVAPLDARNPVYRFVEPTARLARERGLIPVFFANPMNREFFEQHALVDWAGYDANLERLREAVERGGGLFLDYTDAIPASEFLDNDHLTVAGARHLAERLLQDCRPWLSEAGAGP